MIFFDVGGTLVQEQVQPAREIVEVLRHLGVEASDAAIGGAVEALAHAYHVGIYAPATEDGERSLWRTVATVCLDRLPGGSLPHRVEGLAAALEAYPDWYAPISGMPDLLAGLRAEGCRLGVISNWPPSLPKFLEHHRLGPFEVIAGSGPLRSAKPGSGIFRWALARAGVAAAQAWYVGNEPAIDYLPAQALGMRAILWDSDARHAGSSMRRAGSAEELRWALAQP